MLPATIGDWDHGMLLQHLGSSRVELHNSVLFANVVMIHWDSRNKELKGKYSCPLWNCFMANVPAAFWKGKVVWVLYKAIKGLNFLEDFLP